MLIAQDGANGSKKELKYMTEDKKKLLLIFVKNPVLGKVKTRLAKDIGDEKALQIYHRLLEHTFDIAKQLEVDIRVCYSGEPEPFDVFNHENFEKVKQKGEDLGDKMANAFQDAFNDDYKEVIIIGSDCFELKTAVLKDAFRTLGRFEVVMGPAFDGGYYLLGLKSFIPELFVNKHWSTETVLHDTLEDLNQMNIAYDLLPGLSDVDELSDLPLSIREEFGI